MFWSIQHDLETDRLTKLYTESVVKGITIKKNSAIYLEKLPRN